MRPLRRIPQLLLCCLWLARCLSSASGAETRRRTIRGAAEEQEASGQAIEDNIEVAARAPDSSSISSINSATEAFPSSSDPIIPRKQRWLLGVPVVKRPVRELFAAEKDDDRVEAMIGFKTLKGLRLIKSLVRHLKEEDFLIEIKVVTVWTNKTVLQELEDASDDIEFIERDEVVLAARADVVPWGIQLTQADSGLPESGQTTGGGGGEASDIVGKCSDPNAFRVGLVDSGIYSGHPDLLCKSSTNDPNCVGNSFGTDDPWHKDMNGHGTHVAGIISALGTDDKGVRGMVEDGNICLVISRVFGDSSSFTSLSSIVKGIRWAVNKQKVKVVNLSLTGGVYSVTSDRFFKRLTTKKGVLVVAASGNGGSSVTSYPAGYDSVLSVGAIDENKNRASFSQYNNMVDFTAPGVDVMSTAPRGLGSLTWLSIKKSSERFYVKPMKNSPKISDGKSGNIVLCPDQGKTQCPGSGDHICLIRAGDISFEAKALNCQKGGGMAALVYNDEDAGFSGAISQDTEVKIPILSMSGRSGKLIVDEYLNNSGRFGSDDGYISLDGTSMAAPHVTGAIAAIWRGCGNCKNTQVLSCLQTTALDLGAPGKDDYYGYGLIQTSSAYDCLKSVCC